MSQSEYFEGESNGNNSLESFSTIDTYTIYFQSGTDTASARYVPLQNLSLISSPSHANGFIITPDKAIQVVGINGISWKSPKTVNADTNFGLTKGIKKIRSITINTLSTNTTVNVLVVG